MSEEFDEFAEEDLLEFKEAIELDEEAVIPVGESVSPKDDKWLGIPPPGKKPMGNRYRFTIEIAAIIVIEILLWAIYRYFSAPYLAGFGTTMFFVAHIIAAPTIHLGPILLYWYVIKKEKGLPFNLTKRNVFTGIIVGLFAGLIWRVIQYMTFDTLGVMMGGYQFGTLTWYSEIHHLMDDWMNFLLMTFVMYVIVGPVEEFEFRGFTMDQMSRAQPMWTAVLLSGILFGCSHIPIALFVYKFPPPVFAVALLGWITAGFVFGVLYWFSRNIFACIVMHAIGNWTLSVMYFSSSATTSGMSSVQVLTIDVLTTIIADVAMIVIFILIYIVYWRPRLEGKTPFQMDNILRKIDRAIVRLDHRKIPTTKLVVILVVINLVFLGSVMGVTRVLGTDALADFYDTGPSKPNCFDSDDYDVVAGPTLSVSEYADENTEMEFQLEIPDEEGKKLKSITLTVTWTDEEDYQRVFRTFKNRPDEFAVAASVPPHPEDETSTNISESSEFAQNTHGSPGEVSLTIEVDHLTVDSKNGTGSWTIIVKCGECQDKYADGPSALKYNDLGNDFQLSVATEIYADTGGDTAL
jgi:membrane protease YdiL (CAAX protease family)